MKVIALINKATNLRNFTMQDCGLEDSFLTLFGQSINPAMETLNLDNNPFTSQGLLNLCKCIMTHQCLRQLSIKGVPPSKEIDQAYAKLASKNKQLLELQIDFLDAKTARSVERSLGKKRKKLKDLQAKAEKKALKEAEKARKLASKRANK